MDLNTFAKLREVYDMLEDDISRKIYSIRAAYETGGRKEQDDSPFLRLIMEQLYPQLRMCDRNKNIIIYGAGFYGTAVFKDMQIRKGRSEKIKHFWDRNYKNYPDGVCGMPVLPPGKGLNGKEDQVIIASVNPHSISEMRYELSHMAISPEDIFEAKDFCGPWKDQYFAYDIITYQEDEIFLDVGSLNFYTSGVFIAKCDTIKKIYAFEPIPSEELKDNINNYPRHDIALVEAAAWHKDGYISFDGYTVGNNDSQVKAVKIDDVIDPNEKVTFIKMDIEGAEMNALKGAARTITAHKPKLAISIYHKPDDMVDIPMYIKSLVPEYKLYVRHYSSTWYETILYAVLE